MDGIQLGKFPGWFSLGLGLFEMAAAQVPPSPATTRRIRVPR